MKNATIITLTFVTSLMMNLLRSAKRRAIQEWADFMTYSYGSPF